MTGPMSRQQFADFTWQSRWNDAEQVAALSESGNDLVLINCMGVVRLTRDDAYYLVRHLRAAANLLENTVNPCSKNHSYDQHDVTCDWGAA